MGKNINPHLWKKHPETRAVRNNPCPKGFRPPTVKEILNEGPELIKGVNGFLKNNFFKFTLNGGRLTPILWHIKKDIMGGFWAGEYDGNAKGYLVTIDTKDNFISPHDVSLRSHSLNYGLPVRCIEDKTIAD